MAGTLAMHNGRTPVGPRITPIKNSQSARFNLSMTINSTAEVEDDGLMPMATGYEEGSNKPIHTRFAYRRDVIAFRRGQIAWVPILVPV